MNRWPGRSNRPWYHGLRVEKGGACPYRAEGGLSRSRVHRAQRTEHRAHKRCRPNPSSILESTEDSGCGGHVVVQPSRHGRSGLASTALVHANAPWTSQTLRRASVPTTRTRTAVGRTSRFRGHVGSEVGGQVPCCRTSAGAGTRPATRSPTPALLYTLLPYLGSV